jgi:hypothetical protein
MALPNSDVVLALFESYLSIRSKIWKKTDEELNSLAEGTVPGRKVQNCKEIISMLKKVRTIEQWMQLNYFLDEKERAENSSKSGVFYTLTKPWVDYPLLALTIHAARGYINGELAGETKYKDIKESLITQVQDLMNAIDDDKSHAMPTAIIQEKQDRLETLRNQIASLQLSSDAATSYFQLILQTRDPLAKDLQELSFADYVNSVTLGKRLAPKCNQIMLTPKCEAEVEKLTTTAKLLKIASPLEFRKEPILETKADPVVTEQRRSLRIANQMKVKSYAEVATAANTQLLANDVASFRRKPH